MKNLKLTSYLFIGSALFLALFFHLMTAIIGGMTVFLVVNSLYQWLGTKVHSDFVHKLTVLTIVIITITLLSLVGIGVYSGLHFGHPNIESISVEALNLLQQIKVYLPESVIAYIPEDVIQLKEHISTMLQKSLPQMLSATTTSLKGLFHVIVGMLIGGIIAFSFLKDNKKETLGPLTKEIVERLSVFSGVFQKVIFAQVKISSINTVLTAIYLLAILPMFDITMPYAKTLVILTFLCGLLPVIGNLLSNTFIVAISLMVSPQIAAMSLLFLFVIHKLEYFINAKIVGSQIKISIWEMLIVMLSMETFFGIIGVILGPIIYGYIKEELRLNKLI